MPENAAGTSRHACKQQQQQQQCNGRVCCAVLCCDVLLAAGTCVTSGAFSAAAHCKDCCLLWPFSQAWQHWQVRCWLPPCMCVVCAWAMGWVGGRKQTQASCCASGSSVILCRWPPGTGLNLW
jgi:hypothetical protein